MRQFRALSVALTAVTAMAVTGCGMFSPAEEPPPAGPKLTVGIKFDQPGVGLRSGEGTFDGLDMDVARYVGRELGVDPRNITFVEARSGDREAMLEQGKVDMIAASYSITDARKKQVDFAGPYFVAGQSLLVRKTNGDITGPESLDYSDWKLCTVSGSTPAQKVKDSYARSVTLQEFSSYSECLKALEAGDIDALTTDDVILAGYAAQQPEKFKLVGKPFSTERYGVGLRKGDQRRAKVTEALRKMISDGTWNRIVDESVGKSGYKIPEPPQVAENP